MIELPEALNIAKQLNETVKGLDVGFAEAAHSPHGFAWYNGEPKLYGSLLEGKRLGESRASGGRVEIPIGDIRLSLNDGVNLRLLKAGDKRPDKHQLLIELSDGCALVCTVQMYGGMMALLPGETGGFYVEVGDQKPSPLSDEFDYAYFESLLDGIKPSLSAKALLATEQRIPGLGNGTAQDILFNARTHPKAKVLPMPPQRRRALLNSVKSTLKQMADAGGRDTEKDIFGNPGRYQTILSSKTVAYACPACGGSITRQAYLGGNVYFCAHCQEM